MSLLTNDKATVGQSNETLVKGVNTIARPPQSLDIPLSLGILKQKVGYAVPRDELWSFFYDTETGAPMQMPQGWVLVNYFLAAQPLLQVSAQEGYFYMEFVSDVNDPDGTSNTFLSEGWDLEDINQKTFSEQNEYSYGSICNTYNYLALQNDYYPEAAYFPTAGVVKVTVLYF